MELLLQILCIVSIIFLTMGICIQCVMLCHGCKVHHHYLEKKISSCHEKQE